MDTFKRGSVFATNSPKLSAHSKHRNMSADGGGGAGTDNEGSSLGASSTGSPGNNAIPSHASRFSSLMASVSSPLSRSRLQSNFSVPPMPEIEQTGEMFTLECAVSKPEFFALVMKLLPTQQAENRLRLLRALLDYSADANPASKKARGRKLTSLYLVLGATYEVEGIPSHVLKMELEDSVDCLKYMIMSDLLKISEVRAILESEYLPEATLEQQEQLRELNAKIAFSEASPTAANKVYYGDLARIGQLERVIFNAAARRELVQRTLICSQDGVGVSIRFIAAVDQYLACEDEADKRRMGNKIRLLFVTKGEMFTVDLSERVRSSILLGGQLGMLEEARLEVLRDLSTDDEVAEIVSALIKTISDA